MSQIEYIEEDDLFVITLLDYYDTKHVIKLHPEKLKDLQELIRISISERRHIKYPPKGRNT